MKTFVFLLCATICIANDTVEDQRVQAEFDQKYFELHDRGFETLRHIFLHLAKSMGKIATYCEAMEHGKDPDPSMLLNEALPDLYMHALQIANLYYLDLGMKYEERIESNIQRLTHVQKH